MPTPVTRTITRETASRWGLPHDLLPERHAADYDTSGTAVELHTEQTGSDEWTSYHRTIFRAPDDRQVWGVDWEQSLSTELQEPVDPFGYSGEITLTRQEPVRQTITVWRTAAPGGSARKAAGPPPAEAAYQAWRESVFPEDASGTSAMPGWGEAPLDFRIGWAAAAEAAARPVYRERARLLAHLAVFHRSVIVSGADPGDPARPVLFADTAAGQMTWHLHEDDLDLFPHVEKIPSDDPAAPEWDGHTTDGKYARLTALVDSMADARDSYDEEWAREGWGASMSASERHEHDQMSEAWLDAADEARDAEREDDLDGEL